MTAGRTRCRGPVTTLVALTVLALAATGCRTTLDPAAGNGLPASAPSAHDGRIQVVAAESLWGDLVRQIGGNRVDVTSVLSSPAQDPHEYQSGVGDAVTIARADLVVVNGADYDPFMDRLLSVGGKAHRTVVTVAEAVGSATGANPHFWYDPAYVDTAATAFERALAAKDPAHTAQFRAGLTRLRAGEQRVRSVIDRIRRRHGGTRVGYTEPVPGYLVQAAGLVLGTPRRFSRDLENGTDPTPGDSARFEQAITGHRIAALLLNTQVTDPETQRLAGLARSAHVPVVDVTESLPRHEDFQTWQASQATALLRALDG